MQENRGVLAGLRLVRLATASIVCALLCLGQARAATDEERSRRVDELFSKWNTPDSPGAVVAVIRDGGLAHVAAYGMANVEHGVLLTRASVFHLASVSKQFTAFSIHLLEEDGKLRLDDDVRKHLPELPDYGRPVTIRQLINHTSGVRDQWTLLGLAGWRLNDVITENDVRRILARQTELNFPPGDQFLYSNGGYTLLAMLVERVSGKPLAEFARERIFDPLGMKNTRFQSNYGDVVKGRAYSYTPAPDGGYRYVALSYSTVGPSSLFSTVEDLALWDDNFYSARVGGPSVVAKLQVKGRLNSGEETAYASGLIVDKYRGLKTAWHSGADAGYRTNMLRFPEARFTVIVLANAAELDPAALSYRIADIYLEGRFKAGPAGTPVKTTYSTKEVALAPQQLEPLLGDFEWTPGFVISFLRENGGLVSHVKGQGKDPLTASSTTTFFSKAVQAEFVFHPAGADGRVQTATLRQHGQEMPLKRVEIVPLTADQLGKHAGTYYSEELGVAYEVSAKDAGLVLRHPRGELSLAQVGQDAFTAPSSFGVLRFACAGEARCAGFSLDSGLVRNLSFRRMDLAPAR